MLRSNYPVYNTKTLHKITIIMRIQIQKQFDFLKRTEIEGILKQAKRLIGCV